MGTPKFGLRAFGLLVATLLAFSSLAQVSPAMAADSFSINPSLAGVVDAKRSSIDFGTLSVNQTKNDNVIVKNSGDRTLSLVIFARYAYLAKDGTSMLIDDSNSPALDSAAWMGFGVAKAASYSFNLTVGNSVVIPVTTTVPKDALPGAHKAAIVVAATLGTGVVTVGKRVALMTTVQVPGDFVAATSPIWVKDATFYELNVRNFTAGRTFKTAGAQVDDLKALGVRAVIIDPIFKIGTAKLVGTVGSIFAVQDLTLVNPSLGTIADFKTLVTALHTAGIKVVLSVPLDKAAIDNTWVVDNPDWFARDTQYNLVTDPTFPFLTSYNYQNPKVAQTLYESLKPWVVTQDVDGFSFSGGTGIPVAAMNSIAYRLQTLKPLLIGTSDQLSAAFQPKALVFNSNDNLRVLLESADLGTQTSSSYKAIITEANSYSGVNFPLNAVSNYKTMVGLQTETARMGAALPLSVALTFTLPGVPCIFQGQEIGSIKALKPYDADNIVWPTKAPAILATYVKLVKLKKLNAALFTAADGATVTQLNVTSTGLLAFKRTKGTNTVIVVANLTKKALTAKFDAGAALTSYLFSTDKSVKLTATGNSITLAALGYEIYTPAIVK
ncbi:MAG: alpha-amylase family glycosyl hydrolase [Rhodoluna sp.]|nr:alpha-amylase family glycosyl hydrolase [Rhodoluna sp.]